MSYRRLANLIQHLPREAATVQAVIGPESRWGDTEYLLALIADSVTHQNWLVASNGNFKNVPRKPPKPLTRPGEQATKAGETLTVNITERTTVIAGELSFAELDAVIARQTGTASGIATEGG